MKPNNYKLNRLAPEHQHTKTYHHIHSLNRLHHHQLLNHTNHIFHILVNFNIQFLLRRHM